MPEAPAAPPSRPQFDTEDRVLDGRLTYFQQPPTPARVTVRFHGPLARQRRAWQALGTCWGLMIVAVFIPLAHFVLVPGLLIAGPVMFAVRSKLERTLVSTRGACPACGVEQTFTEHGRLLTPQPLRCGSCRRELKLEVDFPGGEGGAGGAPVASAT